MWRERFALPITTKQPKEVNERREEQQLAVLAKRFWLAAMATLRRYFNAMPDKEDEDETVRAISAGVSFRGASLWVLVFAIFIASLGLNVNSTAVIIGAMLISPLMGPIIGMGLAVGISDFDLLKRSVKNYLVATVISVITAMLYFLLTPLDEAQSELLARTAPTLYDVLIALCGGAAGIVALATRGKGNVLPGVAIATALMPPLCTAGFGLATGNVFYFLGAFYLFFINTVFIALATYVGVRMFRFRQRPTGAGTRQSELRRYMVMIVVVTMIPAAIMTYNIVRDTVLKANAGRFVSEQLDNAGTRIVSYDVDEDSLALRVVAVGREITDSAIAAAGRRLGDYKMGKYSLRVIQGTESDSVMMLNDRLTTMRATSENYSAMLRDGAAKMADLQDRLNAYARYEAVAPEVAREIGQLFPAVEAVSLSLSARAATDTVRVSRVPTAVVELRGRATLGAQDRRRMTGWLTARLGVFHVVAGKAFGLAFARHLDEFGRNAAPQLVVTYLCILQHERPGGHHGPAPHLASVEQGGPHAYQCAVMHGAGMHGCVVADGHVVAYHRRAGGVGDMDARAVLDVGAVANGYRGYVAAHDRVEPYGAFVAHCHLAYDCGVLTEVAVLAPSGCQTVDWFY